MSVFRLRDDALDALGLESERVAAIRARHEATQQWSSPGATATVCRR